MGRNLGIVRGQFESSVRPVLTPSVTHGRASNSLQAGPFSIVNNGPNEVVISRVELDFYCSKSENSLRQPIQYPLLQWRLLTPGQSVTQNFTLDPAKEISYHEDHDGECDWIFTLAVACSDLLRMCTHV